MRKTALQKVEEIAKKIADELGYQLYGVRAYMEDGTEFLEVSVDKDYAITLDQITVYSDALSLKLDEVEELDSPYTLDVTSPGAERDFPKEDLGKVIGYYIGVKADNMKEKEVFGTLESYDGTTVELKTFIKGRKKVYKIPYSDIKNCRFVIKA